MGFTDDVKKGGPGGGGGGGFTAPMIGHDGLVPMPVMMPMPMPTTNPPFSYPPPKGPVSSWALCVSFFCERPPLWCLALCLVAQCAKGHVLGVRLHGMEAVGSAAEA